MTRSSWGHQVHEGSSVWGIPGPAGIVWNGDALFSLPSPRSQFLTIRLTGNDKTVPV